MKKIYCAMVVLMAVQFTYSQAFEIKAVNENGGKIGVQMRETSGTNTPTTSDVVADLVFGIRWSQSYGANLDLTSSINTSYSITKSGSRQASGDGLYYYQAFSANPTGFYIPADWIQNSWVEIMSITNNLLGNSGTGTFEICPQGFETTTNPAFAYGTSTATYYYPTVNGSASGVPLPVELTSFTALANNNAVNLTWKTATEVNNYGFDVQRLVVSSQQSANSQTNSWKKIGFVQGAGNSNSPKSYSFTDDNPAGGTKLLYRLKQEDIDGGFKYSDTVEVTLPVQYALFQNYPNPFNPTTEIKFSIPGASRVSLVIYNIIGQVVANLVNNEYLSAGYHSASFNGRRLASGTYIYRLQAGSFVQIKKMILLK